MVYTEPVNIHVHTYFRTDCAAYYVCVSNLSSDVSVSLLVSTRSLTCVSMPSLPAWGCAAGQLAENGLALANCGSFYWEEAAGTGYSADAIAISKIRGRAVAATSSAARSENVCFRAFMVSSRMYLPPLPPYSKHRHRSVERGKEESALRC